VANGFDLVGRVDWVPRASARDDCWHDAAVAATRCLRPNLTSGAGLCSLNRAPGAPRSLAEIFTSARRSARRDELRRHRRLHDRADRPHRRQRLPPTRGREPAAGFGLRVRRTRPTPTNTTRVVAYGPMIPTGGGTRRISGTDINVRTTASTAVSRRLPGRPGASGRGSRATRSHMTPATRIAPASSVRPPDPVALGIGEATLAASACRPAAMPPRSPARPTSSPRRRHRRGRARPPSVPIVRLLEASARTVPGRAPPGPDRAQGPARRVRLSVPRVSTPTDAASHGLHYDTTPYAWQATPVGVRWHRPPRACAVSCRGSFVGGRT